jgi:hypothetical protein
MYIRWRINEKKKEGGYNWRKHEKISNRETNKGAG